MSRMKRVRFADLDASNTAGQKPDASPIIARTTVAPDYESPRTSEYRSYKKLREDAGHSLRCYWQHKGISHHRKLQSSNPVAEMNSIDRRHKNEELKSFLPIEKVTPIGLIRRVNPPCLHAGPSTKSGPEYDYVDIFSEKRQKLLRLASEVLSLGVDEFSSKGPDLIAELLRRLGIEMDDDPISKSRRRVSNSCPLICSSPKPSPKSDVYFEQDLPEDWRVSAHPLACPSPLDRYLAEEHVGISALKETEELTQFSYWDNDSDCQQISEFRRNLPSPKSDVYFEQDLPEVWRVIAHPLACPFAPDCYLAGEHVGISALKETKELTQFSYWDSDSACQKISEFRRSLPSPNSDAQEAGFGSSISESNWTQFDRNGYFRLDHMPFELDLLDCESLKSSCWHSPDQSLVPTNEWRFEDPNKTYNPHKTLLERDDSPRLLDWGDTMNYESDNSPLLLGCGDNMNYESDNIISSPTLQLSLDEDITGSTSFDDPDSIMSGSCSSLSTYPISPPFSEFLPEQDFFSVHPVTTLGRYFHEGACGVEKLDWFKSGILNIRDASFLDFKILKSRFCTEESMYGLDGSLNKRKTCKLLLGTSGWDDSGDSSSQG